MSKNSQLTPFTNDLIFSQVMRNEEICRGFLEMIIPGDEFGDIKISERERMPDFEFVIDTQRTLKFTEKAHGVRFDVFIKSEEIWAEIEMQTYSGEHIGKRSRYYQANIDIDALDKGKPYATLPRSYIIFICTFDYFGLDEPVYYFTNYFPKKDLYLDDDTYKIIINTACSQEKVPDKLSSFFAYIQDPDTAHRSTLTEKIDKLVKKYNNEDRGAGEYDISRSNGKRVASRQRCGYRTRIRTRIRERY